ncbi:1-acyl-sn-glycerol-3-phosphate acyltransferase [Spirochaeta dissipatitropha]
MKVTDSQKEVIELLMKNARSPEHITPETVHQIGNDTNRKIIASLIKKIMLPGSCFLGFEHLKEFYERSKAGESCLLLVEHYSNFDIPAIFELLEQQDDSGKEIADSLIAIAGMKLSVEQPLVRAFAEAYTRIVIYPSRSLKRYENSPEWEQEKKVSNNINRAALHHMIRAKHNGHIILVFPSGTRYREGDPGTKKGLPEMDSYLKSFDNVLFLGTAGNLLKVTDSMENDVITPDVIVMQASEVIRARDFRNNARENAPADSDLKQHVADAIMAKLDSLHQSAVSVREERLAALQAKS